MRRTSAMLFAAAVSLGAHSAELEAAPIGRSVSASRQFIVYGANARLRGGICDLAERTKSDALRFLQQQDNWETPIVIHAQQPQANLPELPDAHLSFGQTGFGLKLQLDLSLRADISTPVVQRELLRAILLERMYRAERSTPAGAHYVAPPNWLVEGMLTLGTDRDSRAIAETLGAFVASGNITPLEELLRQRPDLLESPSRVVYRAHAAALLSMLAEGPGGRIRLARFLTDLPASGSDPVADLVAHFPALGDSTEQLQKNWTLAVTRLAASERYRLLGCEETERQLALTLRVEIPGRDRSSTYALEEFPRFVRAAAAIAALQRLTQELLLLSGRANPLYRPVLAEYQDVVAQLARGKTKKITERLAKARETREHIIRRMSAIGDYMNWYEATQARSASGVFREYLKAAELALEREPRRRDRISVYLDALEPQFDNQKSYAPITP